MFKIVIRILAWAILLAILAATISPIDDRPHVASGPALERIGAFVLLGLLFCLGYRRSWPLALIVVLVAAGGFEALQMLTPDRHDRLADALVKAAGGIGGVGIGLLLSRPRPAIGHSTDERAGGGQDEEPASTDKKRAAE